MFNFDCHQQQIRDACKRYGVKRLIAFGSALGHEFNECSDLDFLVEFQSNDNGLRHYMCLKEELEHQLGRSVDLVMPGAIRNPYLKQHIYEKTLELYAA